MQLLEPEYGFSVRRVTALGYRIRDGLLRDNKVVPAVLGVMVLLIFAWLIAGALIGGPGDEEGKQQASSQASLAPEDSKNGSSGTPAPEAENRDTESFAAFKPKDPFRQLIPKASETTSGSTTSTKSGSSTSKSGGSTSSSSSSKGGGGFIDQTFPGGSGERTDGGARSTAAGGENTSGAGGGSGVGRIGNADLFNSGGDLPAP